jgi:RNA polymerase sigma factor (TIGR02999 family)
VSAVKRILASIAQGDPKAAEDLLPLVYEDPRRVATHKMANEAPDQNLQPTALVHAAWLRLAGDEGAKFTSRGHFFAATAQAMRQIQIANARRKQQQKLGGGRERMDVEHTQVAAPLPSEGQLAMDQ